MIATSDELVTMVKAVLALWWAFALAFILYVFTRETYGGSIQHQFFLSGLLGFVAGLILILSKVKSVDTSRMNLVLCLSTFANIYINFSITLARSVVPFSLALILISLAYLVSGIRVPFQFPKRIALLLALMISLLPVLHLSGGMGNFVNEVTYPIFGKIRTIDSSNGREAAFQVWSDFLFHHGRLLGPTHALLPTLRMSEKTTSTPLFGLSKDEFDLIRGRGEKSQMADFERQWELGVALTREELSNLNTKESNTSDKEYKLPAALTSSHNQWLDASARGGLLYAMAIAWAFAYVVWIISTQLSKRLPVLLVFSYWSMAVAWGFASQFDDEHWLYHIPYLTLFFIPIIIVALHVRKLATTPNKSEQFS